MNERLVQAALMRWLMRDKNHDLVIPNTYVFNTVNEQDLVSVTRAGLIHEYEIKIGLADFRRDIKKRTKHKYLDLAYKNSANLTRFIPSYFWYVTAGFDLNPSEIPEYAGWIEFNKRNYWPHIHKDAPRLHTRKIDDRTRSRIARGLSFRLTDLYRDLYLRDWGNKFNQYIDEEE